MTATAQKTDDVNHKPRRARKGAPKGRKHPGKGPRKAKKPADTLVTNTVVVDRGCHCGEEFATRWKIEKRQTTNLTRKKVEKVEYALISEPDIDNAEVKTEVFSSVGAARDAIGKVIDHPEKNTPKKADIWAQVQAAKASKK